MPPGVKFATSAACPVFGGKVAHVDDAVRKQIPGVRQVVCSTILSRSSAITCGRQSRALLRLSSRGTRARMPKSIRPPSGSRSGRPAKRAGSWPKEAGDAAKALGQGERLDAAYEMPFLAHAPMEPMNCTAHVRADACEVWVGIRCRREPRRSRPK